MDNRMRTVFADFRHRQRRSEIRSLQIDFRQQRQQMSHRRIAMLETVVLRQRRIFSEDGAMNRHREKVIDFRAEQAGVVIRPRPMHGPGDILRFRFCIKHFRTRDDRPRNQITEPPQQPWIVVIKHQHIFRPEHRACECAWPTLTAIQRHFAAQRLQTRFFRFPIVRQHEIA